jgi:hypothetical protein
VSNIHKYGKHEKTHSKSESSSETRAPGIFPSSGLRRSPLLLVVAPSQFCRIAALLCRSKISELGSRDTEHSGAHWVEQHENSSKGVRVPGVAGSPTVRLILRAAVHQSEESDEGSRMRGWRLVHFVTQSQSTGRAVRTNRSAFRSVTPSSPHVSHPVCLSFL